MITVFRKEIKYHISIQEYARIKPFLDGLMKKDIFAVGGIYQVRSQYYDSITNHDLYDNLCGLEEKRKIRIRIYDLNSDTAKLEYKCKSNLDGVKKTLLISRDEAIALERGERGFLLDKEGLGARIYERMQQGIYMPKALIDYQREAYFYEPSDVRVTFDTNIRAGSTPYDLYQKDKGMRPLIPAGYGILEVKYNQFLPSHIKNIMKQLDVLPIANSKYTNARL